MAPAPRIANQTGLGDSTRPMHLLPLLLASRLSLSGWSPALPLPEPVSNNAVASVVQGDGALTFSLMGIGEKKTWDAIVRDARVYDSRTRTWSSIPPVPGSAGRIAASAVAVGGRVYLLGGYTVDAKGKEVSVPNLDIYTPGRPDAARGRWSSGASIPIAVDDAVAAAYQDRYIVLVSGWSQQDNVADVQVYDTQVDRWGRGTPIPGTPVFGHAGAIAGNAIVYCGGAFKNPSWTRANGKPRYLASVQCWEGAIKSRDAARIAWTLLSPHPGIAQYRMAAGAWGNKVVFSGGTGNPYNYDGIGYDGKPSEPVATTFAWDIESRRWETLPDLPTPTMDHRGLAADRDGLSLVGGMGTGRKLTPRSSHLALPKQGKP